MHALKSELLCSIPGIIHAFGTKEQPIAPAFSESWPTARPRWKQVHGVKVSLVTKLAQELGDVDGVVTLDRGTPIGVVTADCVPILLARKDGLAVAALHAGWRGTQERIVEAWNDRITQLGQTAGEWLAAIGPAISGRDYQVSEELVQSFKDSLGAQWDSTFSPAPRHLDLRRINEVLLKGVGISDCEVFEHSTSDPAFFSYRQGDKKDRQYSIIKMTM